MYVKRNDQGKIIAMSATEQAQFDEQLDPQDPEVTEFLESLQAGTNSDLRQLRSTDTELARVVEDVINLLTDKGIIQFTELPEAAQEKLLQRKILRKGMLELKLIDDDDDDLML